MQNHSTAFHADYKICKIALLIALACVLQISESMIPHPIPGLRLGLANMLTLTALVVLGFGYALEVAILRTVLSSLIMGTFMSPTFILSLGAAVVSTLVMGLFYWLSGLSRYTRLSIIGISIIGAFVHNLVQLVLAYLLLVKHAGIFLFLPWLSIGAVATGWIVGVVTGGICLRLQENYKGIRINDLNRDSDALQLRYFSPGNSWLHRLPAEVKLISLLTLAVLLLAVTHIGFYIGFFLFLCVMLPVSQTPLSFLTSVVRKYLVLILIPFFLSLFYSSGTHILISFGIFKITSNGLHLGLLIAIRIIFLIMTSALLMRTTSPTQLVNGLGRLLRPLQILGVEPQRIATLLSMAWTAMPHLWNTTRETVTATDFRNIKNVRGLLPLLSDLIATLYLKTEPDNTLWNQTSPQEVLDSKKSCISS